MKPTRLHIILFTLACITSACSDPTHVQWGYISDRDDCRARSQYGVSSYTESAGSISAKDKSNMLTQLFCECMKGHEWSVSGCKFKDKDVAKAAVPAQQQPTVVVVQAPPAAAVAAPAPAAEPCPAPLKKNKKRPKRKPDGTCPAPEEYSQQELDNVLNKQ